MNKKFFFYCILYCNLQVLIIFLIRPLITIVTILKRNAYADESFLLDETDEWDHFLLITIRDPITKPSQCSNATFVVLYYYHYFHKIIINITRLYWRLYWMCDSSNMFNFISILSFQFLYRKKNW